MRGSETPAGGDRLRHLWSPFDLDVTERNLGAALAVEQTAVGRGEVLTQLARVQLIRGRLDAARSLLDEASSLAGDDRVVQARVLLERGRLLRRSDGDQTAVETLEQAYEAALATGQYFIAADAAHSCALAGDMVTWTNRGLELAQRFAAAEYWRGTLLMNLGDWQWECGEREESLSTFEKAFAACQSEASNSWRSQYARFGIARALRALGRAAEGLRLIEEAAAWAEEHPAWADGAQVREELGAVRGDLRRASDA